MEPDFEFDPVSAWSTGQCATLACMLEVIAPKPGNVHRGADFEDVTCGDFLASAVAIGPAFEAAPDRPLGQTVFDAVLATRRMVANNTNLGLVLAMAPLAAVPRDEPLAEGVRRVLGALTAEDARAVYAAIALAQPGGLGKVDEHDVNGPPPANLLDAMRLAANRDRIARQYATDFHDVLAVVAPWLAEGLEAGQSLVNTVIHTYVRLLAEWPDSLIARKCGVEVAEQASTYAGQVLRAGSPGSGEYNEALADLDFWLRSDGHRRNPGTTADLVAAGLFVLLREGRIRGPLHW